MDYGICLLPAIPLRKEPNDRAEMLTQMLFGETARIYDGNAKWLSVETDLDAYPGWVDAKQVVKIQEDVYHSLADSDVGLTLDPLTLVKDVSGGTMLLPVCSSLPACKEGTFEIGGLKFKVSGPVRNFGPAMLEGIIDTAKSFLNAPYLWGGRTHLGIDCSGLSQSVYRIHGIMLPRDASQQALEGRTLNFLSETEPGDLAFFDDSEGKIIHVGMIIDSQTIIHASGKVRIDAIDHQGIYREDIKGYSHQLRLLKRML